MEPSGKVNELRICRLALSMASAVFHLHAHDIVHRDIACRNFIVKKNNGDGNNDQFSDEVIIIDFGLSRKVCRLLDGLR